MSPPEDSPPAESPASSGEDAGPQNPNKRHKKAGKASSNTAEPPSADDAGEDTDADTKLTARRAANRVHAFKSRQRKKNKLSELQEKVNTLTQGKAQLERQNEILKAQANVLQQQNCTLMQSQQMHSFNVARQQQLMMAAGMPTANTGAVAGAGTQVLGVPQTVPGAAIAGQIPSVTPVMMTVAYPSSFGAVGTSMGMPGIPMTAAGNINMPGGFAAGAGGVPIADPNLLQQMQQQQQQQQVTNPAILQQQVGAVPTALKPEQPEYSNNAPAKSDAS